MSKEKFADTEKNKNLALELTDMGLSLFVCDGDEPLECVARVDLDDPDFSRNLAGFRTAAEKSVGKGFFTQIWLPDEQVMFRSLKLDEEDPDDLRRSASSALSASTPFQGDSLCFDLGETNGAGYTPVAAIPKEKMDEAMAFATKMRMNPRLITTSNVVSGFSSRPDFKPYVPVVSKRAAPVRSAALAMLLAAPIFLMSTELEGGLDGGMAGRSTVNKAYIASVEPVLEVSPDPQVLSTVAVEENTIDLPAEFNLIDRDRSAASVASSGTSSADRISTWSSVIDTQQPVFTMSGQLLATDLEVSAVVLPGAITQVSLPRMPSAGSLADTFVIDASVSAQFSVLQPNVPDSTSQNISVSASDGFRAISTDMPVDMFRPWPDRLPSLDMLVVDYVQNVFAGDVEIHDLMAVDEISANVFANPVQDPSHVRVANFGQGVLVSRPKSRSAPKLVQPAFMPRPEKRPLPLLPEQAFDFNTMIPIDAANMTEDPPPFTTHGNDAPPKVERPQGLLFVSDEATRKRIQQVQLQSRKNAMARADANRADPLANLISPKAREIVPLAGSNGAIAQFLISTATGPSAFEAAPVKPIMTEPVSVKTAHPVQLAAQTVTRPSLPEGLNPSTQSATAVRELVPYKPGAAAPELRQKSNIKYSDVVARLTLPRPPSRRNQNLNVVVTPGLVTEAETAETDLVALLETTLKDVSEPSEALVEPDQTSQSNLQEQIAAAALPELKLPRPPARPDRTTDVAALIEQLQLEPAPTEPISKYAIDRLFAPVKRPASLEAQAKAIIEQRSSVSFQVAKKQEPVATTPQKSLRIPTGARVGSAATIKDGIALGDISLIGIFGTKKSRRALVRLPQGRYVQISRGDELRGWTVSAVSEDAVRIQKGSKNKILRLPN